MTHALILNALILAVILAALVITSNPLVLMCLLLLKEMPYGLMVEEDEPEQAEDAGNPMGFVHHQ